MNSKHDARLTWISASKGGRAAIPSGPRYTTVARFAGQGDSWKHEAWSLVVDFIEMPDNNLSHHVQVSFLNDGPASMLASGKKFELMEGEKTVALGIVLPSKSEKPA